VGKTSLGAEPRIELGSALQQDHTLPSELRRFLTELRRILELYFPFHLPSKEEWKKINIQ
jgi:hypothetical protein